MTATLATGFLFQHHTFGTGSTTDNPLALRLEARPFTTEHFIWTLPALQPVELLIEHLYDATEPPYNFVRYFLMVNGSSVQIVSRHQQFSDDRRETEPLTTMLYTGGGLLFLHRNHDATWQLQKLTPVQDGTPA